MIPAQAGRRGEPQAGGRRGRGRVGRHTGVPPTPRTWVPRPALNALLDASCSVAVTIVVAPAGAGKSSTAAAWCHSRSDLDVTWVSSGSSLDLEAFAGLCGRPGLVVVDDAHLLPSSCYRLLDQRLDDRPESLHLLLLCRWDPPMPRLAHELQGHLRVLRGDDFRLDDDEARALVAAHAPELPSDVIDDVLHLAGGWAAVVALAAHTVGAARDPRSAVRRLADQGMGIADLLVTQVFPTLPDSTRHLLLCLAEEPVVGGDEAARLTGDARAGELLAELADTGLLVTRAEDPDGDGTAEPYLLHPLLAEVIRRRRQAGGAEVDRAKATVRRAALADVMAGSVSTGFRRLVSAEAWTDAATVMADHGEQLLLQVPSESLLAVATAAPTVVEGSTGACLTVALDRWLHGDVHASRVWLGRVVLDDPSRALLPPLTETLVRLLRARLGGEPPPPAIRRARAVVESTASRADPVAESPVLVAWLLIEVGSAEAWQGDLPEAIHHLERAAASAEPLSRRLHAAALSRLAQVTYLEGRHHSAGVLARRSVDIIVRSGVAREGLVGAVLARARVVQALADGATDGVADESVERRAGAALNDTLSAVLRILFVARQLQAVGGLDEAGSWLDTPWGLPPLPPHLLAPLLVERGRIAARARDVFTLRETADRLDGLGAEAEAAAARAAVEDLHDELPSAAATLSPAAEGLAVAGTPEGQASAEVHLARLLDALGDHAGADQLLCRALERTAAQRVAAPFRQPSAHGTPLRVLLGRVQGTAVDGWARLVAEAGMAEGVEEGMEEGAGPGAVPTPELPPDVPLPAHVPRLTRREREVLAELARGSTYADVADALFVSENTVKTHVSAVYAKLGAARRSEALKTARSLGLV